MDKSANSKYGGYTLMEMLVVLSIFVILAGMTFSSFNGLENTVKMNEYVLTLEQNIRSVQRASMLLERNSEEKWLYGLGIDFGQVSTDGNYKVFKWCSSFDTFGDVRTKSDLPAFDPNYSLGTLLSNGDLNGYVPNIAISESNTCELELTESQLRTLAGYESSVKPPKSNISVTEIDGQAPRYVVFEAVSGRAFFYNTQGELLNYDSYGEITTPSSFEITIEPNGEGKTRILSITNLSGKISTTIE